MLQHIMSHFMRHLSSPIPSPAKSCTKWIGLSLTPRSTAAAPESPHRCMRRDMFPWSSVNLKPCARQSKSLCFRCSAKINFWTHHAFPNDSSTMRCHIPSLGCITTIASTSSFYCEDICLILKFLLLLLVLQLLLLSALPQLQFLFVLIRLFLAILFILLIIYYFTTSGSTKTASAGCSLHCGCPPHYVKKLILFEW